VKKSSKAALLSALVFPGIGHLYLKSVMSGIALVATALAAITYVISKAIERALQISEKLQSGDVPLDIETITELVSQQSSGTDVLRLNIATTVFIVCWLIGIFDSYRVGNGQDKNSAAT